jgi:hypothetical protein
LICMLLGIMAFTYFTGVQQWKKHLLY